MWAKQSVCCDPRLWTSPQVWRRHPGSRIPRACAHSGTPYMPAHDLTIPPATTDRAGGFGGRYVPETLIPALDELQPAYDNARTYLTFARSVVHVLPAQV